MPATGEFRGLVDIGGGRRLYVECAGAGSPLVLLEGGLRSRADIWTEHEPGLTPAGATTVMSGVSRFTRVCAYDRPGAVLGPGQLSRSDPVRMPVTGKDAVADLHALVAAAGWPTPFVLVGHSTGGLLNRLYFATYPDDISGIVLVDSLPERLDEHLTPAQYDTFLRLNTVPPPPFVDYHDLETFERQATFEQMKDAASRPATEAVPYVVMSRGESTEGLPEDLPAPVLEASWSAEQQRLVTALEGGRQVPATTSGHYVMLSQPQVIIDEVKAVVDQVRGGTSGDGPPR